MADNAALNKLEWRPIIGTVGLLILFTSMIYSQIGQHHFVDWDDYSYYVHNPHLDGDFSLRDFKTSFSEAYFSNWSPLSSISIRIGDAVHGPEPGAVLLTNALLHCLASIFLFLALYSMTGLWIPSAFVSLAFAVHPLHVESVAWASQRKDVLAGLFWMLTLWLYSLYTQRKTALLYGAVLVLSFLALLSKPSAVSLPITLLLLDFWPLNRFENANHIKKVFLEKAPIFILAMGVSLVTYWAQSEGGSEHSDLYDLNLRILNAGASYTAYLFTFLWPTDLSPYYTYLSSEKLFSFSNVLSILALVVLTGLAFANFRKRPYLLTGWIWFGITLIPMIGIIQVGLQARADRYMYIPAIGLAVAIAWFLQDLGEDRPRLRKLFLALGAGLILTWTALAHQQVKYWENTIPLFSRAINLNPDNYVAHDKLAVAYLSKGEAEVSERHFLKALELKPSWGEARLRWGLALNELGRFSEAEPHLQFALQTDASPSEAYAGLGVAAQQLGDDRRSAAAYRHSLALDQEKWEVVNNLAWLLATTYVADLRSPGEAVLLAQSASQARPQQADYKSTLAAAYAAAGQFELAIQAQSEALNLLGTEANPAMIQIFNQQLRSFRAGQPVFWSP